MARVIMEIRSHCKLEKDILMNSHISERYFCGKSHHSLWNCSLHLHFTSLHHPILEIFKCFYSYLHFNLSFLALCKMSDAFWSKNLYYRKHNQMARVMWNAILLINSPIISWSGRSFVRWSWPCKMGKFTFNILSLYCYVNFSAPCTSVFQINFNVLIALRIPSLSSSDPPYYTVWTWSSQFPSLHNCTSPEISSSNDSTKVLLENGPIVCPLYCLKCLILLDLTWHIGSESTLFSLLVLKAHMIWNWDLCLLCP